jgi:hypothetical protein
MVLELQQLQHKLDEALSRIRHLEERLSFVEAASRWRHLIYRPHPWRRQLSLRDRDMTVGQLMSVVVPNKLTPEQAAADLELPVEAVEEALSYYAENRDLVRREAAEERAYLAARGYALEPQDLSR